MTDPYDQVRKLYRENAHQYDKSRNRSLFEKHHLDQLLARCPANPEVLDLGCGAGRPIADYLIDCGANITGVDFAPEMLAIAKLRFPNQRWIESDMRHVASETKYDAILSWTGFFHLTGADQRDMFPKFADLLKPGGALLITTGTTRGVVYGKVAGQSVFHASLLPEDYRELFIKNGFTNIKYTPEDPHAAGHTLWLASKPA